MASSIRLKRSNTAGVVPASLAAGELALNMKDKKLFFGDGTSVVELKGVTDALLALIDSMGSVGTGRYRISAGVVRQNTRSAGWQFINDTDHNPVNATTITDNGNDLIVNFGFTAKKVLSFVVNSDDTFAAWGIQCGCSVGLANATVRLAAPLSGDVVYNGSTVVVTPPPYFEGEITGEVDGSELQITHPAVADAFDSPVLVPTRFSPFPDRGRPVLGGFSTTGFLAEQHDDICGEIAWNSGTTFNLRLNTDVTGFSTAWDATNKKLIVTHPEINTDMGVIAVPSGGYAPELAVMTKTGFEVRWYNNAGAYQDTLTASHKLRFRMAAQARINPIQRSRFSFRRGCAPIKSKNLYSPNGNIWFLGIFES